ncbi:MAG TPA: hypothetical protein VMK32_08850 [Burkholderiaceae bacterium]|nr:hypothetical protein [Burkholderiaceae bacterium]
MALVGRWSSSAGDPHGATTVVLTQNMQFRGFSTADGKTFIDFGGAWEVSGNTVTWHYETSSGSSPAAGTTETDEIVAVDASRLVLRSKSAGAQFEFIRER